MNGTESETAGPSTPLRSAQDDTPVLQQHWIDWLSISPALLYSKNAE